MDPIGGVIARPLSQRGIMLPAEAPAKEQEAQISINFCMDEEDEEIV